MANLNKDKMGEIPMKVKLDEKEIAILKSVLREAESQMPATVDMFFSWDAKRNEELVNDSLLAAYYDEDSEPAIMGRDRYGNGPAFLGVPVEKARKWCRRNFEEYLPVLEVITDPTGEVAVYQKFHDEKPEWDRLERRFGRGR